MDSAGFNQIYREFRDREEKLIHGKNDRYNPGDDRLAHFKKAAQRCGITPSQLCLTYMQKHLITIEDAVKSGDLSNLAWEDQSGEGLWQRIADVRAYLILLAMLLEEEREWKRQT